MYSVYLVKNKKNGKKYIGCSCDVDKRVSDHMTMRYNQYALYEDVAKYGVVNFSSKILFKSKDRKLAYEKESFFIKKYKTTDPRNGYNRTDGGPGGNTIKYLTEEKACEKREKMRIAMKGKHAGKNNPMWGKKRSKETRDKARKSMLGKNSGDKNGMFIQIPESKYAELIELRKKTNAGRLALSLMTGLSESVVRRILRVEGFTR